MEVLGALLLSLGVWLLILAFRHPPSEPTRPSTIVTINKTWEEGTPGERAVLKMCYKGDIKERTDVIEPILLEHDLTMVFGRFYQKGKNGKIRMDLTVEGAESKKALEAIKEKM